MRKLFQKFREYLKQREFKKKLQAMDAEAAYNGSLSWMLFPPSYYYTHTQEEIERDTEEAIKRLRQKIEELREYEGQQSAANKRNLPQA